LESYAGFLPGDLEALGSEERHKVYKMLRMCVETFPDGSLKVSGLFVNRLDLGSKPKETPKAVVPKEGAPNILTGRAALPAGSHQLEVCGLEPNPYVVL
jgi:hypothetical protein